MSTQRKISQSDRILQSLTQALKEYRYTAKSEEEKQQMAQNRYASAYEEKRLAARQSYEAQDQALTRELEGLQDSYDRQREESAAQYREAMSGRERNALRKGMQRSSYQEAILSGLAAEGAKAQQELGLRQSAKEEDIRQQQTLAAAQLADTLSQTRLSEQSDVQSYMDELNEKEAEKAAESRENYQKLLTQIYQYRTEREKEKQEQARWLAEFRAKYPGKTQ